MHKNKPKAVREMKILVVDDDPLFTELMRSELSQCGYHNVRIAFSGEEALKIVSEAAQPFDCFLLDINMPGMCGVELCTQLRRRPETQGIPIIMVTVLSEVENVDRAFAAGATDYLNKPLNRRELRGRLGMAEGMSKERAARMAMADHTGPEAQFDFEEPIRLETTQSYIDYMAMQNYALKLGAMRMFSRTVLGFRVVNAQEIFELQGGAVFQDAMSDVAEIIVEALGPVAKMLSYAGAGEFVALVQRYPGVNMAELADRLDLQIGALNQMYMGARELPVSLAIGAPVSKGLLSFQSPVDLMDEAIYVTDTPVATVGGLQRRDRRTEGRAANRAA